MKKGNSKDTAPKRPGRPKKKVIGGEKVLKEYRSKRRKLTKIKRTKDPTAILPTAPKVISKGAIQDIAKAIESISKSVAYKTNREKLIDLATKVDVRSIPQQPKHITSASVKKLSKLVDKYQTRWELKQQYTEIRSKIESLPWHVKLPKEPKTITRRSVKSLEKIYEKYSDKAPRYREKEDDKDDFQEAISKAIDEMEKEQEKEEPMGQDLPDLPRDDGKPDEGSKYEDEVIDMYVDFIKLAYDYGHAGTRWNDWNGETHDYNSTVHGYIMEQAQNCLDMLERIGAYDDDSRKYIISSLITKSYDIYSETEKYLYYYRCVFDIDGMGVSTLQQIEEMLTEVIENRTFTEDEKKRWSEVADFFGEDYGSGYYE